MGQKAGDRCPLSFSPSLLPSFFFPPLLASDSNTQNPSVLGVVIGEPLESMTSKSLSASPRVPGPSVWSSSLRWLSPGTVLNMPCPSAHRSPSPHLQLSPAMETSARVPSLPSPDLQSQPSPPCTLSPLLPSQDELPLPAPERVSRASGTTRGWLPGDGIHPVWHAGPRHLCVTAVRGLLITRDMGGNDRLIAKYLVREFSKKSSASPVLYFLPGQRHGAPHVTGSVSLFILIPLPCTGLASVRDPSQ